MVTTAGMHVRVPDPLPHRNQQTAESDEVLIRFSGEVYDWMKELLPCLADATEIEDVATIAIEFLHQALGESISVGGSQGPIVYDLWRLRLPPDAPCPR
jgi:hypothetical protein